MTTAVKTSPAEKVNPVEDEGCLKNISISKLVPFTLGNFRTSRTPEKFKELVSDMKNNGQIQPIVVRHITGSETYEVLAGFGRWEAALELGWDMILVRVYFDIDDAKAMAIHFAENFHRESLSVIQEAAAAQQFYTLYQGDIEACASMLSLDKKTFAERLELNRCTDYVKSKVGLKKDGISIGHALIAAGYPAETQNGLIERVIKHKIKVSDLRKLTAQSKMNLCHAKFDVSACESCEFNSKRQSSLNLFDDEITSLEEQGTCSNNQCYQDKTKGWLEEQYKFAEDRYGQVLYFSQVGNSLNTVSAKAVGKKQFTEGCSLCSKKCALMDDRSDNLGEVTEDQCIDIACFGEKVKQNKPKKKKTKSEAKSEKPSKTNDAGKNIDSGEPTQVNESDSTDIPEPSVEYTVHKRVEHQNQRLIRLASANYFKDSTKFQLASILSALSTVTHYTVDGTTNHETVFLAAMKMEPAEVQKHIKSATQYMMTDSTDESYGRNYTGLMKKALKQENGINAAIAQWVPSKEILEAYTIQTLKLLLEDAGFNVFYDNQNGEGSFIKLLKGQKSTIITKILEQEFDWSNFAPRDFLKEYEHF